MGLADGSLSAAQIAECLNANPLDSNSVTLEESMRAVFPIGMLGGSNGNTNTILQMKKTVRWTFKDSDAWTWWVYNPNSGSLTTGATVLFFAKLYGVWVS